jgi:hypothetical protein
MRMRVLGLGLVYLAMIVACDRESKLETRTFKLTALGPESAAKLIEPYVYRDRSNSPGLLSFSNYGITVRERPENLKRIEAVLKEYDREVGVTLRFDIVEATDAGGGEAVDPEILQALKPVLRYPAYREVASSIVQATSVSSVSQEVGTGQRRYKINADIIDARRGIAGSPDYVRLLVGLESADQTVLKGSLMVPDGKTVVVGSAQPFGSDRAIFLVVRPTIHPLTPPDSAVAR